MGLCVRRFSRRGLVGAGVLAAVVGLAACGSAKHFANLHRPPLPENLTVYVDNAHVAVSPARIGGGPVTLLVTNESSGTQDVTLARASGTGAGGSGSSSSSGGSGGSGDSSASNGTSRSSGDINSGATADIQASVSQGVYEIRAGGKILPARLTITHERQNADNALLQP